MKGKSKRKKPFHLTLVLSLIAVAAVAVLSFFFLTVIRVSGDSMTPNIQSGDVILAVKNQEIEKGDVVAFYYGNKILVRRVIGVQGDWIDIDENGTVSVNSTALDEPYVRQAVSGEGDVEFPYQVNAERYFVLSDNRETAADSRTSVIGCISEQQLVGKVLFRIWPLNRITFNFGG